MHLYDNHTRPFSVCQSGTGMTLKSSGLYWLVTVGWTRVRTHNQLVGHGSQHPAQHHQQQLQGPRTSFPMVPTCTFHQNFLFDVFMSLSALIASMNIRIQGLV